MLLEITSLHANYGRIRALQGVDVEIREGELVALVGANGAGKSTLMRVISGVHPVLKGLVRYRDHDITRASADSRVAGGISQVPEGRQVFAQMSIEDNLILGGFTRTRQESLEDIDYAYAMFPVLKERRHQLAGTLSGGEQQMLAIGRALMARPQLLLLDEPSMGLAPILVEQTFATIQKLAKRNTTIFIVEQNAYLALSIADRGYIMESGRTTITGPGKSLLDDERVKTAYLGTHI